MKTNKFLSIAIERYLDKDMKPSEKMLFEKRLLIEPDLQEDIKLHKEIRRTIKVLLTKKQLTIIAKEYFDKFINPTLFVILKRNHFLILILTLIACSALSSRVPEKIIEKPETTYSIHFSLQS
ncbi:MAG: hypothetical protein A2275_19135 [Bacteroidetes bacterium RIFOXYA12_FULL_35_11]|nr:MAG: hypothetical protein A2X01_08235 [Bacteroidetes bacterium GWF2_35_48]OFY75693.1 MAG: hypothetical protein A2275_19135 [Bacteroidetes bacterium RIFOXYA12_FULL_35_11]OFY93041.1 MAG: hypothetical protein A2309_13625 [Bacteroidetes bacterium RIFOXYB2_FULL_35_7]OFY99142.1 MAG: hypothetical protein A2491_13020 [Bacteroidetes bacterium RIFOXYC12_FULL_35_7]